MDNVDEIGAGSTTQILTVFLDDHIFGIPIIEIQDVLSALDMTGVPLSGSHIEGVMNLRGRIVTALNLYGLVETNEELIEHGHAYRKRKLNVVVEKDAELYSFLADGVGDVLNLKADDIEPPPITFDSQWRKICAGVFQLDENVMIVLDVKKIIEARVIDENEAIAS